MPTSPRFDVTGQEGVHVGHQREGGREGESSSGVYIPRASAADGSGRPVAKRNRERERERERETRETERGRRDRERQREGGEAERGSSEEEVSRARLQRTDG